MSPGAFVMLRRVRWVIFTCAAFIITRRGCGCEGIDIVAWVEFIAGWVFVWGGFRLIVGSVIKIGVRLIARRFSCSWCNWHFIAFPSRFIFALTFASIFLLFFLLWQSSPTYSTSLFLIFPSIRSFFALLNGSDHRNHDPPALGIQLSLSLPLELFFICAC